MQAFEVEFAPAHLSPLHITDAIRAEKLPRPHVAVGDVSQPGKGVRIPLTSRLTAAVTQSPMISRARAFRDPKTGRIVLGVEEQATESHDARALVLFAASSRFPEGVAVTPQRGVAVLAKGQVHNGQQLLLIWPDGGKVTVEDPGHEARYELSRAGDQFERIVVQGE